MPVPQLQQQIDSGHFSELIAYDRLRRPDGVELKYYLALLCLVAMESNRDKEKQPTPFKLTDIMLPDPLRRRKRKRQSEREMFEALKAFTLALGGTVHCGDYCETGDST